MSQLLVTQISPVTPGGTINFTGGNPPTYNGAPFAGGGGGGGGGGPASGYVDPRPIRSTPPAPTALSAAGAFKNVILAWDLEDYINHSFVEVYRSATNNRASSSLIGKTTANVFTDVNVTVGSTYFYWVRAVNIELVAGAYNAGTGATGVTASLLRVANADLGNLIVEAAQLADGAITAAKLATGSISSLTQFASSLEPISVVGALPNPSGYTGSKVVFLTTDGKIYRYTGGAWVAGVPAADLTGSLTAGQIPSLDASKITTGTFAGTRLATGAVDATKFASGIEPVTIVSSVPGVKSTNAIFDTTTNKLYRWNGTAYVASVPTGDLTGTLTDSQIADLNAAKLTGTLNVSRIAAGALDATKFAASIEPITLVTSVPGTKSTNTIFNTANGKLYRWNGTSYVGAVDAADITGTISTSQIADGSISATKFASSLEPIRTFATLPTVKSTNVIFNEFDGKLYRWNTTSGTYVASVAAADVIGTVSTAAIADGSIAATKFASSIQPFTIVSSVPGTKSTDVIFNTTDDKIYRWNGTAYTTSVFASDITVGTITTTQISDGAITTPKMTANSINADRLAAGTISTNLMTANSINGDRISANTLAAGKITAGSITATQIAAAGITGDKIAANTITADKLVANSITSAQIAAGSISGDRITSNSIDAGKIVAGTLTSTQIAASGITGDRIAAGTVTADRLQANSITTTQITAGGINGDRITASTITAGQIAAGAIGATQIAAQAITTSKLLVTGSGSALNDDPSMVDLSAWATVAGTAPTRVTLTDGISGAYALRFAGYGVINSRAFPVTAGVTYRVSCYARQVASAGLMYVRLECRNASSSIVGEILTAIAPGILTNLEAIDVPPTWTRYSGYITAPAGSVSANIGLYVNSGGIITDITEIQDLNAKEYIAGDLIVDGSIVTQKMSANSINGDRILANTLAASKIVAGSITTDRFSTNSIGGSILQDGTISSSKIVANSITAGQIQAGAINAAQIAAGAVTASKLTIANSDSVFPDPKWEDRTWWTGGAVVSGSINRAFTSGGPIADMLRFTGTTGNFDFLTQYFDIELGASYRARAWVYITGDFAGQMAIHLEIPGVEWSPLAIPRSGVSSINSLSNIDNSLPRDSFLNYVSVVNNPATIASTINPNTKSRIRFAGNVTAGNFYFALELVRANTSDLIVDGAITSNKMTANSINGDRILANSLAADKIIANSITSGQISAGAINAAQISAGAISADKLAVGAIAVGTAAIQNGALTNAMIANLAVDSAKIADGAIVNAKIANATITSAKISSVDAATITAGTLSAARIGAGTITADKVSISNLSALSSELGNVAISTAGFVRSGQTAYNTGIGWWIGIDAGVPRFSMGNPAGSYLRWNGSTLELNNTTINNPILQTFSATVTGGTLSVVTSNGYQSYGTRTISVAGGTSPFSYLWTLNVSPDNTNSPIGVTIANPTSGVAVLSGFGQNNLTYGSATCVVTDATGRTTIASFDIGIQHGTPL